MASTQFDYMYDPEATRHGPSIAQRALLCSVIVAIWALTHRYSGIWHDGVLYAGQALFRLNPDHFTGDLFFAFGSQDSYSLFGPTYALLISRIGLASASFSLMVATQIALMLSAALLANSFHHGRWFWPALLLLAVLPRTYGADDVFAYAETFVTARVVAEPLVLAGLALLLMKKRTAGNILLAAGTMFHPVIAFPAIVTAFAMQATWRITFTVTAIGILFVGILLTGLSPAPPPLRLMDAEWYQISLARSPFVFLDQWTSAELAEPLFWSTILFLAGALSNGKSRRFWFSVLFAGLIGFLLAAIASRWPLVLLVQMQTWRAAWLVKVCGILAAVWVARELLSRGGAGQVMACLLAACLLAIDEWGAIVATITVLLYLPLSRSNGFSFFLEKYRTLIIACIVLASGATIVLLADEFQKSLVGLLNAYLHDFPRMSMLALELPRSIPLVLGALTITLILVFWKYFVWRAAAGILSALIVLTSGFSWTWVFRHNSSLVAPYAAVPEELRELIRPGSLTYMEGWHTYLWFSLDRASYASTHQAAGVIFSRNTAIEAQRRLGLVSAIGSPDSRLEWRPVKAPADQPDFIPSQALVKVCQDPILDFVVLQRPLRGKPQIQPMASVTLKQNKKGQSIMVNVFECKRLRK